MSSPATASPTCAKCVDQFLVGLKTGKQEAADRIELLTAQLAAASMEIETLRESRKYPEWLVVGNVLGIVLFVLRWIL